MMLTLIFNESRGEEGGGEGNSGLNTLEEEVTLTFSSFLVYIADNGMYIAYIW